MEDTSFQVMNKNNVAADVSVRNNRVYIKHYDPVKFHCLFPWEETDVFSMLEILEGRCFPRNRANIDELLSAMGLKEYQVMDIIKKTHGLKWDDYTWIRFEGENLTYEDIKIRED